MMKLCLISVLFATVEATTVSRSIATAVAGGPLSTVFKMLADLQASVQKEGQGAQKVYDEFSAWCSDRSKNIEGEVKDGKAEVADLSAAIQKASSKMASLEIKIEELSGSIASNEADLKAATEMRKSEAEDFALDEKETLDLIQTLERMGAVLNRELAKGGASMMQLKGVQDVSQAMDIMVRSSVVSSADASRLTSLLQSTQIADVDSDLGATALHESHSGSLIATLEDLLEKAKAQLASARRTEATSSHNYAAVKQSLTDGIAAGEADMTETKRSHAASEEARGTAEGDLSTTEADLKEDLSTLSALYQDCKSGSEDFQMETKSRTEELKALGEARKVLADALPAAAQTYGAALDQQASFLQISRSDLNSQQDLAKFEAVRFIRDLARTQNSVALAQLASQMSSVIRSGSTAGTDPVAKAKSLVTEMLSRLQKDALSDASHEGFCDKETSETKSKKDQKTHQIDKLATKIASKKTNSARLQEEMATLAKENSELSAAQLEGDRIRSDESALYKKNRAEMKAGISGVKKALSVLNEYYAQEGESRTDSDKKNSGILGLLVAVESDFTKGLAEMEVAESTAVKEYEATTSMNKVAKRSKDKELAYKKKEAAGLDKSAVETNSDKDGSQAELDALLEYLAKLNTMCMGKAEPYAERKSRRDAEIGGLKQALTLLGGEGMLLQKNITKRSFRGTKAKNTAPASLEVKLPKTEAVSMKRNFRGKSTKDLA